MHLGFRESRRIQNQPQKCKTSITDVRAAMPVHIAMDNADSAVKDGYASLAYFYTSKSGR
ncbi:hypothetical protein, partial [Atlantibacter hermannii]|uniref:hypothetical protein n=1 Tax=Atlantibacter hermannii TaxID=565 RepID=UPI00289C63BE